MNLNIITREDRLGKKVSPRHIGQWTSAPGVTFLDSTETDCTSSGCLSETALGNLGDILEGREAPSTLLAWEGYFEENIIAFDSEDDVMEAGVDNIEGEGLGEKVKE